jgi:polyhydroxyalkanoate synthase
LQARREKSFGLEHRMAEIGEDWGSGKGDAPPGLPSLADVQHWTGVIGQAQQMLLEHVAATMGSASADLRVPTPVFPDPAKLAEQQGELIRASLGLFGRIVEGQPGAAAARMPFTSAIT